jgi:hypothetical protein
MVDECTDPTPSPLTGEGRVGVTRNRRSKIVELVAGYEISDLRSRILDSSSPLRGEGRVRVTRNRRSKIVELVAGYEISDLRSRILDSSSPLRGRVGWG